MGGSISNMNINKEMNISLTHGFKHFCGYLVILSVAVSFTNTAFAQTDADENSIRNHQIWIDFYPHYYVNKKLEYYGDAGYRAIVSKRNWSRIYVRPSLRYHFNKTWELQTGLGIFYIFNLNKDDQFEITPWQGFQLNWPTLSRINFKHLFKLEERLSFETKDWKSDFELRFRYKIFGNISFVRAKKWFIPFYGEYFLPLSGKIEEIYRNKGRAGLGLGYRPDKEWQVSFVFNWQGSRAGPHEGLNVSDYIYQIKIKKVWRKLILK
jgi:hypothetical protein